MGEVAGENLYCTDLVELENQEIISSTLEEWEIRHFFSQA